MKILLLYYNKVTNDAFNKLAINPEEGIEFKSFDLSTYGVRIDVLGYSIIKKMLSQLEPFDTIIIGDVFWDTGQSVCRWGKENNISVYFLQHGQWIFIENKKSPKNLPRASFLYGDHVKDMVKTWDYAKRSQVYSTGNPRYDNIVPSKEGEYVYFAPHMMYEDTISGPNKTHHGIYKVLQSMKGIDEEVNLVIHPHYREGAVGQLSKFFPNAEIISPNLDPLPFIQKSSKVLTHRNSTTVLDAIACGKPVVLNNFIGYTKSFFPKNYFCEFAKESNWPPDCVSNLQSEFDIDYDNYNESARPYVRLGNSSKRIMGIIKGSTKWDTD